MSLRLFIPLTALLIAACDRATGPSIHAPLNLTYRLEPSGDPDQPTGVLLQWDAVDDNGLEVYRIYSRAGSSGGYDMRASTTSTTFHDVGVPDFEYYVTALHQGGDESDPSNVVRIDDNGLRLPAPTALSSVSLNGAIHLVWTDNAFSSRPSGFRGYRVYSTGYDLDDQLCDATWSIEGTTISPQFLATNMTNGVPRCFAVSAESIEGFESPWSPLRNDTPRPDARNVVVWTYQSANPQLSGFRFWEDLNTNGVPDNGEIGRVVTGDQVGFPDFWLDYDVGNGNVYIVPDKAGTDMALYDDDPIDDLTSIDIAPPIADFSRTELSAEAGFGYVFQMLPSGTNPRYGAIRVTHVSPDYVILDWSYQTDPGNPELLVGGGFNLYDGGVTVKQR